MHTPDGAPCGLLNHLSAFANVVTRRPVGDGVLDVLMGLGMLPRTSHGVDTESSDELYDVILDGLPVGWIIGERRFAEVARLLRQRKCNPSEKMVSQYY